MLPEGYSPFTWPADNSRKHSPFGYEAFGSYRQWLRDEFLFRCHYCLHREQWCGGSSGFHVDHIKAKHSEPELLNAYDNLVYSCVVCNLAKSGNRIPDPACLTSQAVLVNDDGSFSGQTKEAVLLIDILSLNRESAKAYRRRIMDLCDMLRHQTNRRSLEFFEFPADLPNLSTLNPKGNNRPESVATSCFEQRSRGELPAYY